MQLTEEINNIADATNLMVSSFLTVQDKVTMQIGMNGRFRF